MSARQAAVPERTGGVNAAGGIREHTPAWFDAALRPAIPAVTPSAARGAAVSEATPHPRAAPPSHTTHLIGVVAHELRAPLAAIKGFTTLLLDYADRLDPGERRQMLEEIDAATERMHELIDSLLDLTRLQAGMLPVRREPVDLTAVLRRAVTEAAARYPARAVQLEIPPALPLILGDARRLGQVVQNLLDNAVRYSPSDSPVAVRAWHTADGGVAFAVTDRGIGISPEHHDRIFTPFYRVSAGTAREVNGCGLGLAICRGLVEAHGGSITVDSQAGTGATFTVRLPAWRAPAEARAPDVRRRQPPPKESERCCGA